MAVDGERLREELRRMRALIEKDQEVRARFDADGNGVIDGHEWEQVRQLVTQRLEREVEEAREASRLAAEAGTAAGATAGGIGAIAQGIFESDLPAAYGAASGARTVDEADELILEQQGGLGQLLEGVVRRRYAIFGADGEELGTVEQVENEMLQGLAQRSIFDVPDLNFRVTEAATGEVTTFRRSQGLGSDRIDVVDAAGRMRAGVEWKLSLLGRKFAIQPSGEGGTVIVKGSLLRPFTLAILDCVDDEIGAIERGWSGLGSFLTGGNRMRIRVQPGEVTPEQRWGLLAAALLADLSAEKKD